MVREQKRPTASSHKSKIRGAHFHTRYSGACSLHAVKQCRERHSRAYASTVGGSGARIHSSNTTTSPTLREPSRLPASVACTSTTR